MPQNQGISNKKLSDEVIERIAEIIAKVRPLRKIVDLFRPYHINVGITSYSMTDSEWEEFLQSRKNYEIFVSLISGNLKKLNERENGFLHMIEIINKLADPKAYIGNRDKHTKTVKELNEAIYFDGLQIEDNRVVQLSSGVEQEKKVFMLDKKTVENIIGHFRIYDQRTPGGYLHLNQIVKYHNLEDMEEIIFNLLKLLSDAYCGPVLDKKTGTRLYRGENELLFRINSAFNKNYIYFDIDNLMEKIKEIAPVYGLFVVNGNITPM